MNVKRTVPTPTTLHRRDTRSGWVHAHLAPTVGSTCVRSQRGCCVNTKTFLSPVVVPNPATRPTWGPTLVSEVAHATQVSQPGPVKTMVLLTRRRTRNNDRKMDCGFLAARRGSGKCLITGSAAGVGELRCAGFVNAGGINTPVVAPFKMSRRRHGTQKMTILGSQELVPTAAHRPSS